MRVTAKDALSLGLVDEVISEPLGGAHRDTEATGAAIKEAVSRHLKEISRLSRKQLLTKRHERLRSLGRFSEAVDTIK